MSERENEQANRTKADKPCAYACAECVKGAARKTLKPPRCRNERSYFGAAASERDRNRTEKASDVVPDVPGDEAEDQSDPPECFELFGDNRPDETQQKSKEDSLHVLTHNHSSRLIVAPRMGYVVLELLNKIA